MIVRTIKHLFLLSLVAVSGVLRAQHVPDAAFAAAIRSQCPTCIDANDELTPDAAALTTLNLRSAGVQNLSGIEGFASLELLDAAQNNLSTLPNNLPNSIQSLDCSFNLLSALPASLPTALQMLTCHDNQLLDLPTALPTGLRELRCENNPLSALPPMPASIEIINCANAQITTLPALAHTALQTLNCEQNQLRSMPDLPASLEILSANENQLTALPSLPSNLQQLYVEYNNLTQLPQLPNTLQRCFASHNRLSSLPNIPASLITLDCRHNQLLHLPNAPAASSLQFLFLAENQLLALPDLSMCSQLRQLDVRANPLVNIAAFPAAPVFALDVDARLCLSLACLPHLHDNIYIHATPTALRCLPNIPLRMQQQPPAGGNLPVCSPVAPCADGALIYGKVLSDDNNDCIAQNERPLSAATVAAIDANSGQIYRSNTNSEGGYALWLPRQSNYSLQLGYYSPLYTADCPSIALSTPANSSATERDLSLSPASIGTAWIQVDLSAILLRRCSTGVYWLSYQNAGTAPAAAPYIDVEFDAFLSYVSNSAGIAAQALGGNVYRFPLPALAAGSSGAFSITVNVSCNAVLGQTHCTEAVGAPALDAATLSWTGAIIAVTDSCINGDTVLFTIHNRGGNMLQPERYQIIEDNLMYRPLTPYQLGAGQSLNIFIPARESATYRLEAKQAPLFPRALGDSVAWAINQHCNGISQGQFAAQFNTNYGELWRDNDCTANRASYDPNDKQAQNIGWSIEHCVTSGDYFDYRIRYQNTGTDTAFFVVILDTLDENVYDLGSIELGASSHAGQWSFLSNNVLQWASTDIRLVDSATNAPASIGMVNFRIRQKAGGNPVGTDIENRAAIYFDYNAPVITNTARHRICADFIAPIAVQRLDTGSDFLPTLSPNPTAAEQQATLHWSPRSEERARISLYDALGRLIWQIDASGGTTLLPTPSQSGIYFLHIATDSARQYSLRWQR